MASSTGDSSSVVGSGFELSRIIEEHRRQDEKRRVKRAANRKSASTSRARKKAYVDDMTAKNERMKQHALVLSMLPDLVLAVCRTGEMTYVSPACQWLLLHSPEDMTGANIFELVAPECHPLLRKIISDNLSRPVKSIGGGAAAAGRRAAGSWSSAKSLQGEGSADGDGVGGGADATAGDGEPQCREKKGGNHRERPQQRCRQPQSQPGECGGIGNGGRGGGAPTSSSLQGPPKMKMLRVFRGDKTTVWCEGRLSVRNAKSHDGYSTAAPVPLEIVLTLRTVAEGGKTAVAREFAGGQLSMATGPSSASAGKACAGMGAPAPAPADADDADREEDAEEEYVEADDDGYQCEVEAAEEDSNNSGSGNDSGTRGGGGKGKRAVVTPSPRGFSGASVKQEPEATGTPKMAGAAEAEAEAADPAVGREERSLSKKRQRVSLSNRMDEELSGGGGGGGADKCGEDNSSTGGDTGGFTTHEGSVSCSNEADSTGEGWNNEGSSKWGDGDGGGGVNAPEGRDSYRDCGNSSEDGDRDVDGVSEESTSAGRTEFGDDVQNAVQSLILMGGDYSNKAAQ
ncbi:unnamed protein product [Ectocarpus sp. CCAP 1310/34]|nr:unnamed protein product [Ectocarpus sp. CCAP 1310/34]